MCRNAGQTCVSTNRLLVQESVHDAFVAKLKVGSNHRVPTPPPPLPLPLARACRNHLNEEITPLLPTGIGERYSQTISNLGHASLLSRCELPL
jgi:hypothetical protein